MELVELLSAIGSPFRGGVRLLFLPRYGLDHFAALQRWRRNAYARNRFGDGFQWRVWLLFDVKEMEEMEDLINAGSDEEIWMLREARLESQTLVALVGALLASVAIQALNMPLITEVNFFVRGLFALSSMLSILATFFTCIQQRELGVVRSPRALRAWLSNGVRYKNCEERFVYQSSMAALQLLEAPYELISIAIQFLVGGMMAYLGSAWVEKLKLSTGGRLGDLAVIICFTVGVGFAFALFPTLLGCKLREVKTTGSELTEFQMLRRDTDSSSVLIENVQRMDVKVDRRV